MTTNRAAIAGLVLAALQLATTLTMAGLASIVWQQGLPQDYDTAATMTPEALAVSRIVLFGSIPLFLAFIASMVLLYVGRRAQFITAVGWVMLLASVILGFIGYRTWGGFGW